MPTRPASPTDQLSFDGALDEQGPRFALARIDPGSKPFSSGSKAADKAEVDSAAMRLDALQDLFYADRRRRLLVVLQGLDTSGKDGTIRHVFGRMSALGVRTVGWKAPNEEERAHDFLWRIHAQLPRDGEIVLFNRSHYEDVLVPVVNGWIDQAATLERYAHINDFERLLTQSGTTVLKFMLHISRDEQLERLRERLADPTKYWKFAVGDLKVREQWDLYQAAYERAIDATGTAWAPWHVVPADSKTHRNLMIAAIVERAFKQMKLRYPPRDPALKNLKLH